MAHTFAAHQVVPEPTPVAYRPSAGSERDQLTSALRLLLALPQLVISALALIGAVLVSIVCWVCWIAGGSAPDDLTRLIRVAITYAAQATAYTLLLTDVYPPFAVAADYPVSIAFTDEPLARQAVLFRVVIAAPALALSVIEVLGCYVIVIVQWVVSAASGRDVEPMHATLTVIHRYLMRTLAYVLLATPTYPWGAFGDAEDGDDAVVLSQESRIWLGVVIALGFVMYVIQPVHLKLPMLPRSRLLP